MMPKERLRVWFVARAFPPLNAIGVERSLKWIRALRTKGCEVRIFTVDHTQLSAAADLARVHRRLGELMVTRVPIIFAAEFSGCRKISLTGYLRKSVYGALTRLFMDSGWIWATGLKRELQSALQFEKKPDLIIATGSPFLSFAIIRDVASHAGIPYLLDYRDSWSNHPHSRGFPYISQSLAGAIECRVNRDARMIVTVSQGCARSLRGAQGIQVLYNYPDSEYRRELLAVPQIMRDRWPLRVVFAGTLYKGRDLSVVARALALLPDKIRTRIVVDYCGTSSQQANHDFQVEGVTANLCDHGKLSKADALRLTRNADVCLSIVHNDEISKDDSVQGIMTTKIFDYLVLDKCILNIAPRDNELTTWLQQRALTSVSTYTGNNVQGVASFFERLVNQPTPGPISEATYNKDGSDWYWETQFNDFYTELLNRVC